MNDSDGRETKQEDRPRQQWAGFILVVVLLGALASFSVKLAKDALEFSSPWMSVPFLVLAGLMICLAVLPVVLLLRRKRKTGRFFLTRAEHERRFEERLNKLAAGEPPWPRAWWIVPAAVLAVLLCMTIPAIALMNSNSFGQSSPHERTFLWVLIAIIFLFTAMLMYKPIMRGLRPGSYRLSEAEVNKIRARMRKPQPLGQSILMANVMAMNAGVFSTLLFEGQIPNRLPNALGWGAVVFMWIVAGASIWQVFRPSKPLITTPEFPEESQRNPKKSLQLIALGLVLPLALSSIFPILAIRSIHPIPVIYPAAAQAKADLAAALNSASQSHKRILLDFGVNWCRDCQALDRYFHDAKNLPIVESSFIHVRINTENGKANDCINANQDLANQFSIPLNKGVPALAVLSDKGELIYSQRNGEFEDMRHLKSSDLTDFLLRWKP